MVTPERKQRLLSVLHKRQPGLTVVMENVFDPHNISAVMRTCDAVGIQDIYILNTLIPSHKKWGKKSSSGVSKWLTVHQFSDAKICMDELHKQYDYVYTTKITENSLSLYDIDFTKKIALVFGNEHSGVSGDVSGLANGNFIIPQMGLVKSLNISVACAVSLYEAFRQKFLAGHYDEMQLTEQQMKKLLHQWKLDSEDDGHLFSQ
ncbi:MAG: TrmH family RNA methyltransferase [Chitinophagaceae bacterium]